MNVFTVLMVKWGRLLRPWVTRARILASRGDRPADRPGQSPARLPAGDWPGPFAARLVVVGKNDDLAVIWWAILGLNQ